MFKFLYVVLGLLLTGTGCTPSPSTYPVSGELFVTTQSGDAKKAVGLTIAIIKVTPEVRSLIESILEKHQHSSDEPDLDTDKKNLQKEESKAAILKMRRNAITVVTNSEGRFAANVEKGQHIILSDQRQLLDANIIWAVVFDCRGQKEHVILSDKETVTGMFIRFNRPFPDLSIDVSLDSVLARLNFALVTSETK